MAARSPLSRPVAPPSPVNGRRAGVLRGVMGHLTTARMAMNLSPPPEGRPGMQFLALVYVDNEMLEALPAGEPDAMMRNCLRHADELQAEGKLVAYQHMERSEERTTEIQPLTCHSY